MAYPLASELYTLSLHDALPILIHFSTDCVFSGRKGGYTEEDPSDALDLYGRSKFLGETAGEGALTIRSSVIGRELATASGLVEWRSEEHTSELQSRLHLVWRIRWPPSSTLFPYTTLFRS